LGGKRQSPFRKGIFRGKKKVSEIKFLGFEDLYDNHSGLINPEMAEKD